MAKAKQGAKNTSTFKKKLKKSRKGIHSKKRSSKITKSKCYRKRYRGQGR